MRNFTTFLAAYVLSQFFRSFLAVIAPELAAELNLDPQALGNMQALWVAGFVVMQIPVGWALDVLGPRRSVATLMIAASAGAVLFARAESLLDLEIAMVLIGIGCSSIYMGAIFVFGRVNRPEQFALYCSWMIGLGTAGNLMAARPLAFAAETIGWRGAMVLMAGATAFSALAVLLLIKDPPRLTAKDGSFFAGLGQILKLRDLWPLLPLTAIGYSAVLAERGLWAGPYFSDVFDLGQAARGNALLVMAAAMSVGAMIYGPLDRILGTRKWIVATGSAVTALCFLVLAIPGLPLASGVIVMALLGAFGMTYAVLMAHGRSLFPDHLLGRGITVMNVLFIGGAGVLQPISGALMTALRNGPPELAYGRLHMIFAGLLIAALVVYLFSRDNQPQAKRRFTD